jgi:hypothetical protein
MTSPSAGEVAPVGERERQRRAHLDRAEVQQPVLGPAGEGRHQPLPGVGRPRQPIVGGLEGLAVRRRLQVREVVDLAQRPGEPSRVSGPAKPR